MDYRRLRQNSIFYLIIAVLIMSLCAFTVDAETFPYDEAESVNSAQATTSAPLSSSDEVLPSASPQDVVVPHAVGLTEDKDEPKLFWGFVMWILMGVAIATILAVILTTKTKAYRGGGKNRYSSGNKMGGQKHLLNEKYYQNRKRK